MLFRREQAGKARRIRRVLCGRLCCPAFRASSARSVFAGASMYRRVLGNSAGKRCGRLCCPAFRASSARSVFVGAPIHTACCPGIVRGKCCGRVPAWGGAFSGTEGETLRRGARLGQRVLWNGAGKMLLQECLLPGSMFSGTEGGSAAAGSAARLFVRRQHGAFSLGRRYIRRVVRE